MRKRYSSLIPMWVAATLSVGMLSPAAWAADYVYKISMTITAPKGSAGETLSSSQPISTKLSPCTDTKLDQITIGVTYDAGKTTLEKRDVYIILHAPTGGLYPIKKYALGTSSPTISGPFAPDKLIGGVLSNIYLQAANNLGQGAQTETIFGGYINLETIATGTWQVVAIIADATKVDFEDPATWSAWDAVTLMIGKPWAGNSKMTCGPGFMP